MKARIKEFLGTKNVLWNEGKTVALAWFDNNVLVINKGTNTKIRNLIKELNVRGFTVKE